MLAICEECSKKYNIDEFKMKGERARFSCQECGNIVVVAKQKDDSRAPDAASDFAGSDNESA
ncbi:MAG: zinc-ribbon domain-containing protein [Desulfobulbus sp.]|nr:zinc-ribbon domain-containing protein [Desulfobulbus sp.]